MIGSCGKRPKAIGGERKEGVPLALGSLVNLKVGAQSGLGWLWLVRCHVIGLSPGWAPPYLVLAIEVGVIDLWNFTLMKCGRYTGHRSQRFCSNFSYRLLVLQRGGSEKVLRRIGSLE